MNIKQLLALAEAATPGEWDISSFVCRADHNDVKARQAKKVGDVFWELPTSVGPIGPDHNYWAGWNIGCDMNDAKFISAANPDTVKRLCQRLLELNVQEI